MLYRLRWLLASGVHDAFPDPASSQSAKPVWRIPIAVCTVLDSCWWTENLSETCTVLFQNKFEKLVHLVGFIIRIYHDARSSECQILCVWANSDKVDINLLENTDVTEMCLQWTVVSKRCAASTGRLKTNAVQNDISFLHAIILVTDHH
jgi:hypothetical protein